jgi:hypothetical protein
MYYLLLMIVAVLSGYCLWLNFAPKRAVVKEGYTNLDSPFVPHIDKDNAIPSGPTPEEVNHFISVWNGYYPYAKTVPGSNDPDNFLKITMKDNNNGVVSVSGNHWLVRSYGPTLLTGQSHDSTSTISIEMIDDWRHVQERLPRVNIRLTDHKTGKVTSYSGTNPDNLDAFSTKVVNVSSK